MDLEETNQMKNVPDWLLTKEYLLPLYDFEA